MKRWLYYTFQVQNLINVNPYVLIFTQIKINVVKYLIPIAKQTNILHKHVPIIWTNYTLTLIILFKITKIYSILI